MTPTEIVQYQADHIGVLEGADTDFGLPTERPCDECGGLVDLSAEITVKITHPDGSETEECMTEANARQLLAEVGVPPPPVMCDQHGAFESYTEALA